MSVAWKEEYATGLKIVDDQHKRLFEAIDELESIVQRGAKKSGDSNKLVDFLGNYAIRHFGFEEQCMSDYSCPSAEKNKAAHKAFLDHYTKFKEKYDATDDVGPLLRELSKYAQDWLVNHICKIDTHLKKCVTTGVS